MAASGTKFGVASASLCNFVPVAVADVRPRYEVQVGGPRSRWVALLDRNLDVS